MIAFNYQKLKGRMRELNLTQKEVSQKANMSVTAFNNKLNHKSEFSSSEIFSISDALRIPDEEIKHYFFEEKV